MALHLQHPKMTFIGTGQTVHVAGSGNNTEYVLNGAQPASIPSSTAHLYVDNAKAFHGTVDLGTFSSVYLNGITADSYKYDQAHDLLKLYEGNKVVDSLHLNFDGSSMPQPWNILRVQHDGPGVFISDAYHGLSNYMPVHV